MNSDENQKDCINLNLDSSSEKKFMFNDEEKNNDINAFESATFEKLTNREKQIAL